VNYGLPSYKQKQKPAQWLAAEPAQKQRVHERSLENKRKPVDKIDDNAMLITGIRFNIVRLRVNRRTAAAPIRAIEREKSRRSGQHLKAIRRLLGIGYFKASTLARTKHKPRGVVAGDVMIMPGSYRAKLKAIDFNPWSDPTERAAFESLNANLELDEDTAAFAHGWPILENVKRFLLGQEAGKPKDACAHSKQGGYGGFVGSSLQGTAPSAKSPPIIQNKIILDVQNKQAQKKAANFT
jgi:hypothetical protein